MSEIVERYEVEAKRAKWKKRLRIENSLVRIYPTEGSTHSVVIAGVSSINYHKNAAFLEMKGLGISIVYLDDQ